MDKSSRKKLRIVLIAFLIILIPLVYFLKMFYGIYLNDRAVENYWVKSLGDNKVAIESINQLEKAKKFYKKNEVIYYNQARLYVSIEQFDKAIKTLKSYLTINSNYSNGYLLLGLISELNNEYNSAKKYYSEYINLRDSESPKEKLKESEIKNREIEELLDSYLLQDTVSFNRKLVELENSYPGDMYFNGMKASLLNDNRRDLILGMLE